MENPTRVCTRCKVERPLEDFYIKAEARFAARNGWTKYTKPCRKCNRAYVKAKNAPLRKFVQEYKMSQGCMDCGLSPEHPEVLEFDHRPDEEKSFDLAKVMGKTESQLRAEMAKCDVVCANCHRVRTVTRGPKSGDMTRRYFSPVRRANDILAGKGYLWDDGLEIPRRTFVDPDQMAFNFEAA